MWNPRRSFCLQPSARRLHVRGGHAGRRHDEDPQREAVAGVEHVADAGDAEHVGDLVRVGNDAGRAPRHHGSGELGHGDHARFDVHVGVQQAGADVQATHVDGLRRLVIPEAHHHARVDRDVGVVDLARHHVHQSSVLDQCVRRLIAARYLDQLGPLLR